MEEQNITINEELNDDLSTKTEEIEDKGLQRSKKERTEAQKNAFAKAQETRKKNIKATKEK